MKVVVTGACGFIGSNLVRLLSEDPGIDVVAFDALTYAGNLHNLDGVGPRVRFVRGDVRQRREAHQALEGADAVVHMAAESHVDRSIADARPFVETNVLGTAVLLDLARELGISRFVLVSTDEVYGTLGEEGKFTEQSPLRPSSPYAASKASADLLALSYHRTFGLPVVITRCTNNFGPYQFPEKLIPLTILRAMNREPIPVYGDGRNVRDWIHVEDHCRGILRVLDAGTPGEVYNISAHAERANLEVIRTILGMVGAPDGLIQFVRDRPGHDFRYALDSGRTRRELGWIPARGFEEGLAATVRWYVDNEAWCQTVLTGEYRAYLDRQYGAIGS